MQWTKKVRSNGEKFWEMRYNKTAIVAPLLWLCREEPEIPAAAVGLFCINTFEEAVTVDGEVQKRAEEEKK